MKRKWTYGKVGITMVLLGVFLLFTGCSHKEKPYNQTLVLTVDSSKVYLDEMMYHVMLEEMHGSLYASYIGDTENYWDKKNEDGVTMKELSKEVVLENAIRYELLYMLAIENGYTLTEEEITIANSQATNIKMSILPKQLEATQLTDEKLYDIQEKLLLAKRYYEDFLKELGIDETSLRNKLNPEDFKQYDIEYIYGNKQQYEEIVILQEKVISSDDITTLATGTSLNSGKLSFLAGKDTFGEEDNLENIILSMEVGEISDIIETVIGYYIIKLKDNTSSALYEDEIKEAMNAAITTTFEPAYEDLKNLHKIKIEKKIWKKIDLGNETIPNA